MDEIFSWTTPLGAFELHGSKGTNLVGIIKTTTGVHRVSKENLFGFSHLELLKREHLHRVLWESKIRVRSESPGCFTVKLIENPLKDLGIQEQLMQIHHRASPLCDLDVVAVIGFSGVGKTTLTNILLKVPLKRPGRRGRSYMVDLERIEGRRFGVIGDGTSSTTLYPEVFPTESDVIPYCLDCNGFYDSRDQLKDTTELLVKQFLYSSKTLRFLVCIHYGALTSSCGTNVELDKWLHMIFKRFFCAPFETLKSAIFVITKVTVSGGDPPSEEKMASHIQTLSKKVGQAYFAQALNFMARENGKYLYVMPIDDPSQVPNQIQRKVSHCRPIPGDQVALYGHLEEYQRWVVDLSVRTLPLLTWGKRGLVFEEKKLIREIESLKRTKELAYQQCLELHSPPSQRPEVYKTLVERGVHSFHYEGPRVHSITKSPISSSCWKNERLAADHTDFKIDFIQPNMVASVNVFVRLCDTPEYRERVDSNRREITFLERKLGELRKKYSYLMDEITILRGFPYLWDSSPEKLRTLEFSD